MPNSLVFETARYSLYVKVLAGEGDGTLIYIDARGHIHVVGPGDPAYSKEKLAQAVAHIEAGVNAALAANESFVAQG